MISKYEKFRILDQNKEKDLLVEVNWEPRDPKINKCQVLRFIYPNGDEALVKREDLMSILFVMGSPDDQRNLIPHKMTQMKKYQTMLGITATKDIHKGEKINFQVDIPLPPIEDEVITKTN